jgi:diacylglycerol kinase (ATP)
VIIPILKAGLYLKEKMLAEIRWKKFDVIYYEYGALVMLFNSGEMVSKAYHILSNASFDEKQFLVLLLPNIQVRS